MKWIQIFLWPGPFEKYVKSYFRSKNCILKMRNTMSNTTPLKNFMKHSIDWLNLLWYRVFSFHLSYYVNFFENVARTRKQWWFRFDVKPEWKIMRNNKCDDGVKVLGAMTLKGCLPENIAAYLKWQILWGKMKKRKAGRKEVNENERPLYLAVRVRILSTPDTSLSAEYMLN